MQRIFYAEDIIRSQSVVPSYDREPVDVPLSMFAELIDPQKPLNVIADDYGLPFQMVFPTLSIFMICALVPQFIETSAE